MFETSIGPTGQLKGFLRPETAQGIFVNFKRLLEFNGGKLPFAAAQIGQAFRNEIAPRSGLLRVREFTLAEIEHFVNPNDKSHPKFTDIANVLLNLFPREDQITTKKTVKMTIGEAVAKGMVANETLGYFIARTFLFLTSAGIKKEKLRFRQHLLNEMAHYAQDCWDAEIQCSYGWVECVGIADRSCYDLGAHSQATGIPLSAFVEFEDGPKEIEVLNLKLNKSKIGQTFSANSKSKAIMQYLSELDEPSALKLKDELSNNKSTLITLNSEKYEITSDMVAFENQKKRITGQQITPGVIEPSFGIGRILYALLEHAYWCRDNSEQRHVLSLAPTIAPVKVSILPLMKNAALTPFIPEIVNLLTLNGISSKVDDVGQSIGKRYARTDEIGIPYGITIDFQTVKDNTVTVRERDSMSQIRVLIVEVSVLLQRLINGVTTWNQVQEKYPKIEPID